MHKLYRPTTSPRTTVTQEIRIVLAPEESAPVGSLRRVQMLVPQSPAIVFGIDADPQLLGPNRSYKLTLAPPNTTIEFYLMPHQNLVAAAKIGFGELGLVVEYMEP